MARQALRQDGSGSSKEKEYAQKILRITRNEPLSLTGIAISMGYKGITAKRKSAVSSLANQGLLLQTIDQRTVKYKSGE